MALNALMVVEMKTVPVEMDQEDVAFLFRQRDLVSAPVVDNSAKLVGVITIDDVVDVIHKENKEDIMRLAGVGEDDDLYDAVISTTRSRFSWLLNTLGCCDFCCIRNKLVYRNNRGIGISCCAYAYSCNDGSDCQCPSFNCSRTCDCDERTDSGKCLSDN